MIRKGTRVRSVEPTSWPVGKIREGTVSCVVKNSTPLGDRDADTYWVDWDNWQPTGPFTSNELIVLDQEGAK